MRRCQKHKKLTVFFALLWSECIKDACRALMRLTPKSRPKNVLFDVASLNDASFEQYFIQNCFVIIWFSNRTTINLRAFHSKIIHSMIIHLSTIFLWIFLDNYMTIHSMRVPFMTIHYVKKIWWPFIIRQFILWLFFWWEIILWQFELITCTVYQGVFVAFIVKNIDTIIFCMFVSLVNSILHMLEIKKN